jgi:hypothetical protein
MILEFDQTFGSRNIARLLFNPFNLKRETGLDVGPDGSFFFRRTNHRVVPSSLCTTHYEPLVEKIEKITVGYQPHIG